MATHFATVPVESGPYQALLAVQEPLRPLALVVDDEPVITDTLAAILNGVGFAALTASSGDAALEMAQLMPPQVLITDLAMPGLDGLDLAIAVTRDVPDCEVILFSGHASVCDLTKRTARLDCDFVTLLKPVHPADMINCICERLARRGCAMAPPRNHRGASAGDSVSRGRRAPEHYTDLWRLNMGQRTRSSTGDA